MNRFSLLSVILAAGGCVSPLVSSVTDAGPLADAGASDGGPSDAGASDAGTQASAGWVAEHHARASRDGVYVDPALTPAAARGLRLVAGFDARPRGHVYAQPLYVPGPGGAPVVVVATESNVVEARDAATGAVVWTRALGDPAPLSSLPCGNIDPLGVTGTPIADLAARTLYLDAMTWPAGAPHHLVFALSLDDGATRAGWPVDVAAAVPGFDAHVQNQRGALALLGGTLYVPFGGFYGDCGDYRGWVVGLSTSQPGAASAWKTSAHGGGAWAPGGVASDGASLFVATGNTFGATDWSGGEAIVHLAPGPVFSGAAADYFTPTNWRALDAADLDLGGSGPVLFEAPGATPSKLALALGKDGSAWLLDREDLGGVSSGLAHKQVSSRELIGAAAAYTAPSGTYVVFRGKGLGCPGAANNLVALRVIGSPPALDVAWCAPYDGLGSPMVTTPDGASGFVVWIAGAEGSGRLTGYDGETGASVYAGTDPLSGLRRFSTPIAAGGRVYVAGDGRVYAFAP